MFPILGAKNSSKVFSAIASLLVLILLGWVDLRLKIDESQPNLYYPV
jgi:UDP-N-acetylmuramyl pentapeptide phosphotransferase/UDP-N-acetylglucosamine-1-phosphate transferase